MDNGLFLHYFLIFYIYKIIAIFGIIYSFVDYMRTCGNCIIYNYCLELLGNMNYDLSFLYSTWRAIKIHMNVSSTCRPLLNILESCSYKIMILMVFRAPTRTVVRMLAPINQR